jgi:hypothetical protein
MFRPNCTIAPIYSLGDILGSYANCTRLTDAEIEAIRNGGMQLPDGYMLD